MNKDDPILSFSNTQTRCMIIMSRTGCHPPSFAKFLKVRKSTQNLIRISQSILINSHTYHTVALGHQVKKQA